MDGEINGAKLELSPPFVLRLRLSQHYAGGFRHLLTDKVINVKKLGEGGLLEGRGQGQSDHHPNPLNPQNPFYHHSISPLHHTIPARVTKPVGKVLLRDDRREAVKVVVIGGGVWGLKEEWILWCKPEQMKNFLL